MVLSNKWYTLKKYDALSKFSFNGYSYSILLTWLQVRTILSYFFRSAWRPKELKWVSYIDLLLAAIRMTLAKDYNLLWSTVSDSVLLYNSSKKTAWTVEHLLYIRMFLFECINDLRKITTASLLNYN